MNTTTTKAWTAYVDFLRPITEPVAGRVAGHMVERLLGFWLMWQFYGGADGIIGAGVLARTTVYRQRVEFQHVYGMDVSEFLPDVAQAIKQAAQARVADGEQG
jgi:hypothetical protein